MDIVDFESGHADAFRTLNEAWIETYFAIEAKDREVLNNPQSKIIDPGGRIFMALKDGAPVGCVALMKMPDGGCEVAKMTVAEGLRASGLRRKLLPRRPAPAPAAAASPPPPAPTPPPPPALALYRAMGFQDLPPTETPYARADVFMERPY